MLKNKFKYFLILCIILFVFNILSISIVKTAGKLLVSVNSQQVKQGTFLIIKADKHQVEKI